MGYNKPDRTGKRFRKSSFVIMNNKKLNEFKELYPEYNDISLTEFNNIIKSFNDEIINAIVENRDGVLLPEKIGQMLSVDKPVIFDCVVDKSENCFPMIPSGKPHNQMILGPEEEEEISDEGKVLV